MSLLFSDMCGSLETTRDLHPKDAAALVNRLLAVMADVIAEHHGCIDRFQGDGALAVFGNPDAHPEDPERSIRAAMRIRADAGCLGMQVTAGINTGVVYVGPVGSERHRETMTIGPAVGLAARLQELAQPGQILVSEATQRLTRHAFEFSPRLLDIKGLARPIVGYVVERAMRRPETARRLAPCAAEEIDGAGANQPVRLAAGGAAAEPMGTAR